MKIGKPIVTDKDILLTCKISEPVEVAQGIFKTSLTHPALDGELYFSHGAKGRDLILESVNSSILGEVMKVAALVGELKNGKKTDHSTDSTSSTGTTGNK